MSAARIVFLGDSITEGVPGVSYLALMRETLSHAHQARRPRPARATPTLVNMGKGGDTVISITRRARKEGFDQPVDALVLWVGVNDILAHVSPVFPLFKRLVRQPWVRSFDEFRERYRALLLDLHRAAAPKRLITVPPLLIGEDIHNQWNAQCRQLASIIAACTRELPHAQYLDIARPVYRYLDRVRTSEYILHFTPRLLGDLLAKDPIAVDRRASGRGLHLTLDGVHLNSAGARFVADQFLAALRLARPRRGPPIIAQAAGPTHPSRTIGIPHRQTGSPKQVSQPTQPRQPRPPRRGWR